LVYGFEIKKELIMTNRNLKVNEIVEWIQRDEPNDIGLILIIGLMHIQAKRFRCPQCELWYREISYLMEELPIIQMIP
jgi:hypothetical protein